MHLMTLRSKIILLTIVVITALATIFAAAYKPKRIETIARPMVKINAFLPLSGPNAHLGLAAQKALQKFLKQASEKARYKYEIFYEDSYTNSIQSDKMSKAIIAVKNAPEPRIELTINTETPEKFIIHSPYKQVSDLFVEDLSHRHFKNIGLITAAQGNYRTLAQTFKNALPDTYGLNGAVFQPDQKDFGILINLLRNNDTDLFLLVGAPADIDNLVSQLHDSGVSNFNISTLYSIDLTQNLKLYDNTHSVGSIAGLYDSEMSNKALSLIIEAYEKNFKKDYLPSPDIISEYIKQNHAKDSIISIPSAIKNVRDGKINTLKE